jgi:hypothetical protein
MGTNFSELVAALSNQSLEPTVGRCEAAFDFMKQFSMFATLAAASGGSAPSR